MPAPQPNEQSSNVITHPLFGVDSNQNQNQNQNGYGDVPGGQFVTSPNASYAGTFMTPQLASQQPSHQLPPPGTGYPPQSFQTQLPNVQQQQQQQQFMPQAQHQTVASEPIKQKPPLPEEYMYMQTVFNELRTQCSNATSNPVSYVMVFGFSFKF